MKVKLLLKDALKGTIPTEKLELLPSGFHRVGDILVIPLHADLESYQAEIGAALREQYLVKSVFAKGVVQGELRRPATRRIAGRTNTTIHREQGCRFKIDVSKIMFSKGNVRERHRLTAVDGEEVVDMFAGIGYYTIPLAKKTPGIQVHAIEKNPVSIKLLKENLRLNKVDNVEVIERDCRDVVLPGVADRLMMGYFPGTEKFLPTAFEFLRREGVIHFHNVYQTKELWRVPLGRLETAALNHGYTMNVLEKIVVKPISPCKVHVVIDAKMRSR